MLSKKVVGALVLAATLVSTGTAMAGAPAFEFPSANQCIHVVNNGRLDFAVKSNTGWDKCREAYRRAKGMHVIITGTVFDRKAWRHHSINSQSVMSPGKVIRPSLGARPLNQLDPKNYSVDGSFSVYTNWIH